MALDLLIIFATYNGQQTLPHVLEGYERQTYPGRWKLIAVDNASTDGTASVLEGSKGRLPLETLYEPKHGKNYALNCAINYLKEIPKFIIFTDDDAVPQENFLQRWDKVAASHPEANLFGGAVDLLFETLPPDWLGKYEKHFPEIYARNIRDGSGAIEADEIFGPNMAARGTIFSNGFRFDQRIGPNSNVSLYPMGSETEFCTRVARETGSASWFTAEAKVKHIVRKNQMERDFVEKRAYRHGNGVALRQIIQSDVRQSLLGEVKSLTKQAFRLASAVCGSDSANWEYHWHRGYSDTFGIPVARRLALISGFNGVEGGR